MNKGRYIENDGSLFRKEEIETFETNENVKNLYLNNYLKMERQNLNLANTDSGIIMDEEVK